MDKLKDIPTKVSEEAEALKAKVSEEAEAIKEEVSKAEKSAEGAEEAATTEKAADVPTAGPASEEEEKKAEGEKCLVDKLKDIPAKVADEAAALKEKVCKTSES